MIISSFPQAFSQETACDMSFFQYIAGQKVRGRDCLPHDMLWQLMMITGYTRYQDVLAHIYPYKQGLTRDEIVFLDMEHWFLEPLTRHHIVWLSAGGSDRNTNIIMINRYVHEAFHAFFPEDKNTPDLQWEYVVDIHRRVWSDEFLFMMERG